MSMAELGRPCVSLIVCVPLHLKSLTFNLPTVLKLSFSDSKVYARCSTCEVGLLCSDCYVVMNLLVAPIMTFACARRLEIMEWNKCSNSFVAHVSMIFYESIKVIHRNHT